MYIRVYVKSSYITKFTMERNSIPSLCLGMLGILACLTISNGLHSDIYCLRSIKESLADPGHVLSTWDFRNNTEGFICRFVGVQCSNNQENLVLAVSLRDAGLIGPFPIGIQNCTAMQDLDLSGNYLSGSIPSNLAYDLPYLVSLNLSNNNLSGPIPPSIAYFVFINVLRLDNNQLTGRIPLELSQLDHIVEFSVANNRLLGPVPAFLNSNFSVESYANNLGLCGYPMSCCKNEDDEEDLFLVAS
ncbi:putative transferase [Helianthus annuus]|nr:putative transferase [Helianthus annuus]